MFLQQIDGQGPPLAPHPAVAQQVAQVVAETDRCDGNSVRNSEISLSAVAAAGKNQRGEERDSWQKCGHLPLVKKVVGDQADEAFDADIQPCFFVYLAQQRLFDGFIPVHAIPEGSR